MIHIAELIRRNRVETLRNVSTAGTYDNTLDVRDDAKEVISADDGRCYVRAASPRPVAGAPLGHDRFILQIGILLIVCESEAFTDRTLDERLGSIESDAMYALKADYTCGGYATYGQEFLPSEPAEGLGDGGVAGRWLILEVDFRTLIDDPFRQ